MLTNEQLEEIWNEHFTVESGLNYLKIARAIEQAARCEALEECLKIGKRVREISFNHSARNAAYDCEQRIAYLIESQGKND